MLALVAGGLARQGLAPRTGAIEPRVGAVPLAEKRALVGRALEEHGPLALLRVGEAVHESGFEPALEVLLRARGPHELIERWQRLERYAHSRHRCRVEQTHAQGLVLRHVSTTPERPRLAEDLLIFGVLAALLRAVGCRGLRGWIGDARLPVLAGTGDVP